MDNPPSVRFATDAESKHGHISTAYVGTVVIGMSEWIALLEAYRPTFFEHGRHVLASAADAVETIDDAEAWIREQWASTWLRYHAFENNPKVQGSTHYH